MPRCAGLVSCKWCPASAAAPPATSGAATCCPPFGLAQVQPAPAAPGLHTFADLRVRKLQDARVVDAAPARIVLLRHGQSLGNIAPRHGPHRFDPALRDATLSDLGMAQAHQMRAALFEESGDWPDLVVTSPLRRALMTACILLQGCPGVPIHVRADIAESDSNNSGIHGIAKPPLPENVGRPLREMRADPQLLAQPRFATVDFSAVPEDWHDDAAHGARGIAVSEERHEAFCRWLATRPERYIVVVGHHNTFQRLLRVRQRIENCRPY